MDKKSENLPLTRLHYKKDFFQEIKDRPSPEWKACQRLIRKALTKAAQTDEIGPALTILERMAKLEMSYQMHVRRVIAVYNKAAGNDNSIQSDPKEPDNAEQYLNKQGN